MVPSGPLTGLLSNVLRMTAPATDTSIKAVKSSRIMTTNFGGPEPKKTFATDSGGKRVLTVEDIAVFRSGTFADSMGYTSTWGDFQIAGMVSAFELLKTTGVIPHGVPVRRGHDAIFGNRMDTLIGYHDSIRTEKFKSKIDGEEYTYLMASFHIWDQEAADHVDAGHWPYRSAEVGIYETNNGMTIDPMYFGFAYVDLPAVEGLDFFSRQYSKQANSSTTFYFDKEIPVTAPTPPTPPTPAPVKPQEYTIFGKGETDPARIQTLIGQLEARPEGPHGFMVGGVEIKDPKEVQSHITAFETAQAEQAKAFRNEFIDKLASDKRILNTEVKDLKAFAADLSNEQFGKWAKAQGSAPTAPIFAAHQAPANDDENGPRSPEQLEKDNYETNKKVVTYMRNGGSSEKQISESTPGKLVAAYEAAQAGKGN